MNRRTQQHATASSGSFGEHRAGFGLGGTSTVSPLLEGIAKLFNKPDHADVKILIGQYELPAHSVVLATQSPFFQKALSKNFREGKTKQFHFENVEIGSAHSHWRVFEYMYTGNYAEECTQALDTKDDEELVKDVRVYLTAEFFMLDDLKQLALRKFKSNLEKLWVSELLSGCIREVYESTCESDYGLRNAIVEIAHDHHVDLWGKKAFRDLLHEGGDFAVDLMGKFC
ncbi:BTB/POZ domain-containing protein [Xylaria acuta]|nr:BTB/POZ domain-containing protein [Xylaria acuta]